MTWRPWLALPARLLAPLLLVLLALAASGTHFLLQVDFLEGRTISQNSKRLHERMAIAQSRLRAELGLGNRLLARRLVSSLALYHGISDAWLIDGKSKLVIASISRTALNQPFADVLAAQSPVLRSAMLDAMSHADKAIHIKAIDHDKALLGHVDIFPDHHLLVRLDLTRPLVKNAMESRNALAREAIFAAVYALILAALLYHLWYRRTDQLARTLTELGQGHHQARVNLEGHDELAQIGNAVDDMAEQLEQRHHQLRQLENLINQSPVIAVVWRNEPGWPIALVSENIAQLGYSPADLLSGKLLYTDIVHPDDLPRILKEIDNYSAYGPDEYSQQYRLRHIDGHWLWIDDHTRLVRNEDGEVIRLEGTLVDVSARHEMEAVQAQQNEMLHIQNKELTRFNQTMVNREHVMIELKTQVNELASQLGLPPPYPLKFMDAANKDGASVAGKQAQ